MQADVGGPSRPAAGGLRFVPFVAKSSMYMEILAFRLYVIGMSPFMTKCDRVLRVAANEYSVSQTQVIIESSKVRITPTSVLIPHHIGGCWVSHLSMKLFHSI